MCTYLILIIATLTWGPIRRKSSTITFTLFLTLLSILKPSRTDTFTIGYITGTQRKRGDLEYSRPGLMISGAISLAVEEVNKGILGQRGHRLDFIVAETFGEEVTSVQRTAELWTKNVSAYIGPQETCTHEAYMAAAFNLPMISYFCTHYETSDKKKFPTFARTRPPDTQISKSVVSLLTYFEWKHVVLFYLNSTESEFSKVAMTILEWLASSGVNVAQTSYWDTPYHYGYTDNPFYKLVKQTYEKTRIYVIVGHYYEHMGLLIAMQHMGLLEKGEYFVIGVDIEQYDEKYPEKYLKGLLKEDKDPAAEKAFRSYFGVFPSSPVGFDNFSTLVNAYMERPPFNYPNPLNYLGGGRRQIRAEAAYLYDAVHLYVRALIKALDAGKNPRNGTEIINYIKKSYYKSAMGYLVYIDENADAEGNYTLVARKPLKENSLGYGLFPVGVFVFTDHVSPLPVLRLLEDIEWVGESHPIAVPFCGFNGENCLNNTLEIISGVTGSIALIVLLAVLFLYRNWKYEQELDSLLWKIDFREIQIKFEENANLKDTKVNRFPFLPLVILANRIRTRRGEINFINHNQHLAPKTIHPLVRTSQVSLSSNLDNELRYSTIFTQVGLYKGRLYAVKKVHKKCVDLTRTVKKELKILRDLRHDNLNAFIGACTDPSNICIVTEYCSRGSLRDILENEDVKLDSMFIASLVGDILRGMIYLHDSPVRFHGNLHTGNCLVDSRWVVKLSDFGLREFMKGSEDPSSKDPYKVLEKCRKLIYRAPEVLRAMNSLFEDDDTIGTPKADVYSFGIVLHEFYNRNGPFGNTNLSFTEILQRIMNLSSPPFRPSLEGSENIFDFVKDCLKECWAEDPDSRPDFKTIRMKLRPLRKGIKPNIFDNMMAMMEKYANNLEVLVDERTCQLQEEKKKTEALLYEMLPKPVADQLKIGGKIEAESFDCVTIYFSDIVGFTAMSAESTPLQVVDFLNDLYTCFDSVIENFDVYKVETIGDAYMVVSGLPLRNNINHASEIASMSLKLLQEIKQFKIRHRPTDKLLLRIGMHSGPVCAGVVGLKRPRYCLFGDTVNTASRMESTGIPLKIHCSRQCTEILKEIGGYHLIERGLIPIKGKGEQKTFWLLGETPKASQLRNSEREKQKAASFHQQTLDSNKSHFIPKSSLKNKHKSRNHNNVLPRCSSFESTKKIRFASGEKLTNHNKNSQLQLKILTENDLNFPSISPGASPSCCNKSTLKSTSVSCPCIENLSGSGTILINSQLSVYLSPDAMNNKLERPMCYSVPTLCLSVSQVQKEQAVSAPTSPKKHHATDLLFQKSEDFLHANDSTPLLKVTTADDMELFT